MPTGTLKIHSENLMPIIKKWLYSDKDIFVRELVSNACDALRKLKIVQDKEGIVCDASALRIDIHCDKEAKTLTFSDTGIGMDGAEVEKYIAQIAFSGAEEFLGKYASSDEKDQIIGHFGLGFYSAYMVADKVKVETLSYKEGAEAVTWISDGATDYEMEASSRSERGTAITLYVNDESAEFLETARLNEILTRYCAFLPYPIYLNGTHINHKEPLWVKAPSECTDKDYLDFYRQLYPFESDPLFWVHLNVDYPFHVKGILYFPKMHPGVEPKKTSVKLFCNRVFVSDNCQDLLPEFLTILKGAIDSPDIPLNVSRSYLQMDRTVRQLGMHLSKKVAEKLLSQYRADKEAFTKAWPDIEVVVKLGAMQDEKFLEKVKDFLIWKNSEGAWTTVEEYLERHKESYKDKIFYTADEKHPTHFMELYKEKGIEVLYTTTVLDTALIQTLEQKHAPVKFQRIDGALDEVILEPSREKNLLDAGGKTEGARLADFVRSALKNESVEIEAKSLASDTLPGFILIDEETRRMRDYLALTQPSMRGMNQFAKHKFVINTNSKVMMAVKALSEKDADLASELVNELYELSLLSHKEMPATELGAFIARSHRVLEKLAERVCV